MTAIDAEKWAAPVAAELGADWLSRPYRNIDGERVEGLAYLDGPAGQRLHVHVGGYRNEGRVTISWSIDPELKEPSGTAEDDRKSIRVSDQRPAAGAAKEIERRLLPGLLEFVVSLRERRLARDEQKARHRALLAELAELVGGRVTDYARSAPEVDFGHRFEFGGTILLSNDRTVAFDICLPTALALRVAKLIGELRRDGGES